MAFTRVRGPGITTTDNYKVGVITASKFVGPFDGGVIGGGGLDVSGIVTATALDVNGDGHVSGALTVTGNVSIGGTLTYMDVTNIDSVGIITAQAGVHFGIGATVGAVNVVSGISSFSKLNVDGNSTLSTATFSDDVTIVKSSGPLLELTTNTGANDATLRLSEGATGTTNNGGGMFYSGADNKLHITCGTDSTTKRITIDRDTGKVGIGSEIPNSKLEVWNGSNIEVLRLKDTHYNKYLTIRGGGSPNRMVIDSYEGGGGGADIDLASNGITNIRSTSNWRLGIGTGTPLGVAHVNVGGGSTEPFVIERSGSGESIWSMKPYGGNLYFRGGPAVANYATDRFAILYGGHNDRGGDVAFFGTAAGITSCLWDASADTLIFNDDVKAAFGNGSDFTLQHNSDHAIVKNTTGRIYVLSDDVWFKNEADNKTSARFFEGNEVYLYHNDTARLTTTSTGITVGGEVAATQDYPNYRPVLDFNFAAVKKLDQRITYARTGPASYVDEFGIVKLVGNNTPRFDHDPVTKESKGLLIEEARTNMITYSTDYTQSSLYQFSSYEGAISENLGTAPDGSQTDAFIGEGNTGRHTLYIKLGTSLSDSTKYSMSIFVKRVSDHSNERYCRLETASYSSWTHAGASATFDLSNGTEVTSASTNITSGIETYPDGWYRISMTSTTGTVVAGTGFYLNITNSSGSSSSTTLTGSQGLLIYGTQMEAGAFPTSYIPTSGVTATRGLDIVTIDKDDIDGIFNPIEGTMFYEASVTDLTNDNQPIVAFRDVSSTTASYHAMGHAIGGSVGNVRAWARDASSNNIHLTAHSGLVADSFYKHMYGYKYNDYSDAFTQGSTSAQTNTTSGDYAMNAAGLVDELRFGGYYSGPETTTYSLDSGHIKRFSYWPQKLTNTQIKTYVS